MNDGDFSVEPPRCKRFLNIKRNKKRSEKLLLFYSFSFLPVFIILRTFKIFVNRRDLKTIV